MKISKYSLMDFLKCPYRYKRLHLEKVPLDITWELKLGRQFHNFAYKFFNLVDLRKLRRTDALSHFLSLVPRCDPALEVMIKNFCKFEANHVKALKQVYGKKWKNFFFPVDRELHIETKSFRVIIDRIDRLSEGFCVFEYKTSRFFNYRDLRKELVFYAIIARSTRMYAKNRISHIACYNSFLDKFMFEPIHRRTIISVINLLERLKECIDTYEFPRKLSSFCLHCQFRFECLVQVPKEEVIS